MNDLNRKALIYSVAGVVLVMGVALVTDFLAPENGFGETLRFSMPILAGLVSGAVIFFKLRQETDIDFSELGEEG